MEDGTSIAASNNAGPELPGISTSPKVTPNKKRRVSFCNTTKPPSSCSQKQPLLNSIQKRALPSKGVVTKNSAGCLSLPQLQLESSSSLLVSEAPPTDELDLSVSPTSFVHTIVLQSRSLNGSIRGEDVISDATRRVRLESYFLPVTEEHLLAYTQEKVRAVQSGDVVALRALYKAGHGMHASNRFGESMLHASCRRGHTATVSFFVDEAGVSPRVQDDMGRTPMHDVCWNSNAPNHDVMRMLIRAAPEMLLSRDKRGHSPFDYARREHWPDWVAFLNEHRQFIVNSLVSSFLERSEELCGDGRITGGADRNLANQRQSLFLNDDLDGENLLSLRRV